MPIYLRYVPITLPNKLVTATNMGNMGLWQLQNGEIQGTWVNKRCTRFESPPEPKGKTKLLVLLKMAEK